MNNSTISRTGIILYALVIGFFGVNHFLNRTGFQNTIPSFLPYGVFWLYFTGIALIAAAISFLLGWKTKLAGLLLAGFLIIIVLTVHLPAYVNGTANAALSIPLINLVKDTGLAAGALVIAGRGE